MPAFGKFERITYPDGQISARWVRGRYDDNALAIRPVTVRERINSYADLFYVRAIADVIHESQAPALVTGKLFIPCMFGQRSDRRFSNFQSFDLKLITDIINECKFDEVEIFDPHSDVTMALIKNSVKKSSLEFVKKAVHELYMPETGINTCNFTLVSPDAGAYKKVFEYGEEMNLPVVAAVKHRDTEGKINLTFMGDVKDKHCLIIDDLCDGGYTFEVLGKALKEQGAYKVYLYVSHGLFSKGFETLTTVIDHIYCTNSIRDEHELTQDFLTQYKII